MKNYLHKFFAQILDSQNSKGKYESRKICKKRFRFERFWEKLDGFEEAIQEGWHYDASIVDPFQRLNKLLRSTASHLQAWSQRAVGTSS
jgi:hypothetical protein